MDIRTEILPAFHKNWGWFLLWGIVLMALGLCAISLSTFTTFVTIYLLGIMLLACGILMIIDSFQFWWKKWKGFWHHILVGALYSAVGLMLIKGPLPAALSLTFLLAVFFLVVGGVRLVYAVALKPLRWGWILANGLISLLLGILILSEWPGSSLFVIGLFIGIDLFFLGWTYIMMALFSRKLSSK